MNTLPLLLTVLGIFAVAYRYYSALLATRAFMLDDRNITPAHRLRDGHNYVPSPKWVAFGHHFAAIAGAEWRSVYNLESPPESSRSGTLSNRILEMIS